jgi:hypothetical protein
MPNQLQAQEVMVFADELDIHLLPKVGAAWMPKGHQVEVMTPGTNEKHYLAGALNLTTDVLHHLHIGVVKAPVCNPYRAVRHPRRRVVPGETPHEAPPRSPGFSV